MRMRAVVTFLAGLAVTTGSVYAAREIMANSSAAVVEAEQQPTIELVEVIVATRDIEFGHVINHGAIKSMPWPKEAMPDGAFDHFGPLLPADGKEPRRAIRTISKGEIVLASKISEFGEKVTLTQSLGPNLRAVSIKADTQTSFGGLITAGDRVDVVLTQGRLETLRSATILQNARVIGFDSEKASFGNAQGDAKSVILEVTPQEGQKLALAQKAGTLSLLLRTLDTAEDVELGSISLDDVLWEETVETVVEEPAQKKVVVRRGTDVETRMFEQ
ncbi:Flp pilus assembly protein CpaB [Shimia biformata]|uniref:Flp pilus assembly protein CpaB n=1 Tax=Shimia biformata TaxID=1294299 RepID=UPI001950E75E|nr:Flp pilus assembly protein CpaB [Shimia biformata]